MPIDPNKSKKPIFLCQGGVLVEEVTKGEVYLLLEELPSCNLDIGDPMPLEWDLISANAAARKLLDEELFH